MTGLTLISLDQADQASVNNTTVNPIRGNAAQYLVDTQNGDGSWTAEDGDSSAMVTALAVRGLATTTDENISGVNDTAVQQAIDNGTAYLHESQKTDGSWEGYHDQWSYASQGSISESTAHALIALDATGVDNQNATVQSGHSYLKTVYEEDGSWGYTRATAISIEALQTVSSGIPTSQEVTITLSNETRDLYTETVKVNSSSASLKTVSLSSLNNQTLVGIRDTDQTEYEVTVSTEGDGLVIVSASNEQLINENEYEANGGA